MTDFLFPLSPVFGFKKFDADVPFVGTGAVG